jgi:hypothetical protein
MIINFQGPNKKCRLQVCPPGFFIYNDDIHFKNEYGDAYCGDTGEVFWGGTDNKEDRDKLMVEPIKLNILK